MSASTTTPSSARRLTTPGALGLADLVGIFDDLQFTLECCDRLMTEFARPRVDDVVVEALWVSALNSYARCFRTGDRGMGLTVADVEAAGVPGEVAEWHALLGRLRDFSLDGPVNPRETYSVGVSQSPAGAASGVVITSARRPLVDDVTVRQTGRLVFELSRLVDERIKEHQRKVFEAAAKLTPAQLAALPAIEVASQ
ncbi:hypothetical protein [Amycolatopsis sp. SID8362]|uniref:hypothetical protein n=1 Tax=Amycolatopsis sp. SID8362 TaxID=2690346 RepID=UPI00136AE355|nr:hypothetical protein [Amycolatopsis sp. SID8362]NBH12226.1 hypothetical protein [Amycolatopsis sp. SID8362]NED48918.1 hypothetical protein [Amycolatopsis sp. SID8362]